MRNSHTLNPRSNPKFLALLLLLAGMAFVGCGKQENPESTPGPTPPPPVVVSGNRDCVGEGTGNEKCKLDTSQVETESGMPGHSCGDFDLATAIHITKGAPAEGKFKKIHVKKDKSAHDGFTIKVEACPGSTGNPFPHANKPNSDNWESADLDTSVADNSRYHLTMTVKGAKGGSKASQTFDPHIVIER